MYASDLQKSAASLAAMGKNLALFDRQDKRNPPMVRKRAIPNGLEGEARPVAGRAPCNMTFRQIRQKKETIDAISEPSNYEWTKLRSGGLHYGESAICPNVGIAINKCCHWNARHPRRAYAAPWNLRLALLRGATINGLQFQPRRMNGLLDASPLACGYIPVNEHI
jgi:hypothetical protein